MDIKKVNTDLQSFWDVFFEQYEAMTLQKDQVKVENDLDLYIKEVGDKCEKILDLGTGSGYAILTASLLGEKMKEGLAIDPSKVAIATLDKTLMQSKISNVKTMVGTHEDLKTFAPNSFDGILCSNVLDVVPYETSEEMIEEITRLLKLGGYLMVKLNFELNKEIIKRTKAEEIAPNTFNINGVLRSYNLKTPAWIERFKGFTLIKSSTFERIKDGPLDRVLLLRKEKDLDL